MAKPVTGAVLGLIAGVFLAIFIQQTGAWPLDRLLLFGVAGIVGLIGLLFCTLGQSETNTVALIIAIILVIGSLGYAASQLVSDDASGPAYIDNCTLMASSDLESLRSITSMTRSNPFDIDPDGMLHWEGTTSGTVIKNYQWEVFVDVGGFNLRVANGMDPNGDEETENEGDEGLAQYADQVRQFGAGEIRGIYYVSGNLIGEGGSCDGAGYVRVPGNVFESTVGIAAGIIFLIILIILIIVCLRARRLTVRAVTTEARIDSLPDEPGDLDTSQ